jgi:hypothetical protein
MIAGYTFRDQSAVKAWINVHGDKEIFRFCHDMKMQITGILDDFGSTGDGLNQIAQSNKANFSSYQASRMYLTFGITHPEGIFKRTQQVKAASHGGLSFQPAMANFAVFEGDSEYSTKNEWRRILIENLSQHQASIDEDFPPDQAMHARTNAIFSAILRKGNHQALGLLESVSPLYRLLTGAGLTAELSWSKVLTYLKTVFDQVQKVRSITREPTPHAMIFGMMKATEMLEDYGHLEWIRHPDVSSALVISALQRDGKTVDSAVKEIRDQLASIKTDHDEWLLFKRKHPDWNQ